MNTEPTINVLLALPQDDDTLIPRSQVPLYLPVAKQTLARWSCQGDGPKFCKIGKRLVAYRSGDLREWLRSNIHQNTVTSSTAPASGRSDV
jgi:predicted DNA-binding transcriptional regulator AlpA